MRANATENDKARTEPNGSYSLTGFRSTLKHALSSNSFPEDLACREREGSLLEAAISESGNGAILTGPPGAGKSTAVRVVATREASSADVAYAHIDMARQQTAHAATYAVLSDLTENCRPRDGRATSTFREAISDLPTRNVVVLDGFQHATDLHGLLPLLDAPNVQPVLVVDEGGFPNAVFDSSELSTAVSPFSRIRFEPYSPNELAEILEVGAPNSTGNVVETGAVQEAASAADGDAHKFLGLLSRAATEATTQHDARVLSTHVEAALGLQDQSPELPEDPHSRTLFEIIEEGDPVSGSELKERYLMHVGEAVSDATRRRRVRELMELGLVQTEGSTRGKVYYPTRR